MMLQSAPLHPPVQLQMKKSVTPFGTSSFDLSTMITPNSEEVEDQAEPAGFGTVCGPDQAPGVVECCPQRKRDSGGNGGRGLGGFGGLGLGGGSGLVQAGSAPSSGV
jgi:hypothetical protein